jgi:thioredoxin 1
MSDPILQIENKDSFQQILENNPGLFIVKFGAEWCAPCKKIDGLVDEWFKKMPATVLCAKIDVDECFEIYAYLKTKKMVNGIPAILCYKKGTVTYIPDDAVIGADVAQINAFFQRCLRA